MNLVINIKSESYFKGLLYSILLVGLYFSSHQVMISWWKRGDYTYCYLVPFIVLYLVWEKRKSLDQTESYPTWAGLAVILIGLVFFWLGELGGEFYTLYLSSWFVLIGLCLMHLGWSKLKIVAFPLFFIITMFPFPDFLHNKVSFKLKLISSQIGVAMMQIIGMSAFREGNIIDLGFTQLQVVDACNGLRYLIPLILLGILLAYFFKAAWWKRIVLVISTIPISIFVNSLRIAAVGVLYPIWGPKVAQGFFHDFSGWFIFMTALAGLLLLMWALMGFRSLRTLGALRSLGSFRSSETLGHRYADRGRRYAGRGRRYADRGKRLEVGGEEKNGLGKRLEVGEQRAEGGKGKKVRRAEDQKVRRAEEKGVMASRENNEPVEQIKQIKPIEPIEQIKPIEPIEQKSFFKAFFQPQFVVAVILLSATLALSHGVEFREKIPINKSFDQFPMRVGEWSGIRQSMEQKFIDTLDLSDYVIVDYQNKRRKNVNLYVAYYESQRKGESIHTPATCLPGGGWIFKQAGGVTIPLIDHSPETMRVNRAFMQKRDYRQLSYYWFPQRGRILTNAYELKLYTFWDALTRQRTDGALVRVITPFYDTEDLEDAEKRLQGFVGEINPILAEYLPE